MLHHVESYKVNANNQLRFASVVSFHLRHAIVGVRTLRRRSRAITITMRLRGLLLRRHGIVAWRRRLLVELLLVLRGIRVTSTRVDRWRRHGRGGTLPLRMTRRA